MRQARNLLRKQFHVLNENLEDEEEYTERETEDRNIFSLLDEDEEPSPDSPNFKSPTAIKTLPISKSMQQPSRRRKVTTADVSTKSPQSPIKQLSPLDLLLLCERKFLNADVESRRLFRDYPIRIGGGGGGGRGVKNTTSTILVTPDAGLSWPKAPSRLSGGFSMMRSETGAPFSFIISEEYESIRDSFFAIEASGDPQLIFEMTMKVPFCVEALLQLYDYHRTIGNSEAATNCLRQCLYIFENSFHPNFAPWKETTRLSYNLSSLDNKLFNIGGHTVPCSLNEYLLFALLRHVQLSSRRACHESAFECAKLLFSLAPEEDPVRVLLFLDAYALRAGKNKWLIDITNCKRGSTVPILFLPFSDLHILTLPGWIFARALSLFKLECAGISQSLSLPKPSLLSTSLLPTSVTSDLSICYLDATHLLVRALLTYPHLLLPLLKEVGIKETDVGVGIHGLHPHSFTHSSCTLSSEIKWSLLFHDRLFEQPHSSNNTSNGAGVESAPLWSEPLRKMISITSKLQASTWSNPTNLSFLFTCARLASFAYKCAIDNDSIKDNDANNTMNISEPFQIKNACNPEQYFGTKLLAEAEAVTGTLAREEAFFPSDDDLITQKFRLEAFKRYGCVRISDYIDEVLAPIAPELIEDLQRHENFDVQNENVEEEDYQRPWLNRLNNLNLQSRNPILLFFDSLLPWNVIPNSRNDENIIWRGL